MHVANIYRVSNSIMQMKENVRLFVFLGISGVYFTFYFSREFLMTIGFALNLIGCY